MKLKRIAKWIAGIISLVLLLIFLAIFVAYWRSTSGCDEETNIQGDRMKAIVYCDYGSPEVLRLEEVATPVPTDDQILVKVRAAGVNPLDWHYLRGTPYIMRMETGLRKPKSGRFGVDFSGTVEAVGSKVTHFKPGDEVFGGRPGALAEYVVAGAEKAVVMKPANINFDQAASVPIAAISALQGLRDLG
ncbi:MAG: NAD(P)-dependent alcohol dehydrogenase, partial [Verrucomicrobiota bacterium]|nr:NAD(P)-dependent alcohol dehydrogenase [Verrucomicrobiota bacterium]